ncbi:MAG: PorT family protein [Bacteroides sp.]|nr:PorT family protein [Bacteroides sp.]
MNKTKLSILVAVVAVISAFSNEIVAQEKPVTWGIKAGTNLSTFGGDMKNTKSVLRYQVGITADVALTNNLYLLTGLDLQTKGAKYSPKSASDIKYNPMYLQLPVNLGYKFDVGSNIRLVVHAGPYLAYGIGGKARSDGNKQSVFGNNRLKRSDYGLMGGAGMEIGNIAIHAGYEYGLANVSDAKGTKIRNRNPYLTVGYKF